MRQVSPTLTVPGQRAGREDEKGCGWDEMVEWKPSQVRSGASVFRPQRASSSCLFVQAEPGAPRVSDGVFLQVDPLSEEGWKQKPNPNAIRSLEAVIRVHSEF